MTSLPLADEQDAPGTALAEGRAMSARVAELEALIRRTMAAAEDATGEDRPWLVAQADTLASERDRLVEQRRDPAPRGGRGRARWPAASRSAPPAAAGG